MLALLQDEAEEAAKAARHLADWLNGAIALRYADRAAAARRAEGKDTGTVRFDDDEVTVIADLAEEGRLGPGRARDAGRGDPRRGRRSGRVRRHVFRVPERKYAAWPRHIRTAFERARTVKTGKPTFRLALEEAR
jgi:hypothetical protein